MADPVTVQELMNKLEGLPLDTEVVLFIEMNDGLSSIEGRLGDFTFFPSYDSDDGYSPPTLFLEAYEFKE